MASRRALLAGVNHVETPPQAENKQAQPNPIRRHQPLQQVRIAESIASELRTRILSAEDGALLPKQDELVAEFK